MTLEDSTTYQLIFNRGEARGRVSVAQSLVLAVASSRFGPPDPAAEAAICAINDRDRLQRMAIRTLAATDWADLLATA